MYRGGGWWFGFLRAVSLDDRVTCVIDDAFVCLSVVVAVVTIVDSRQSIRYAAQARAPLPRSHF